MSVMMDCWKRTDFSPGTCAAETAQFHTCMAAYEKQQAEIKERMKNVFQQKKEGVLKYIQAHKSMKC